MYSHLLRVDLSYTRYKFQGLRSFSIQEGNSRIQYLYCLIQKSKRKIDKIGSNLCSSRSYMRLDKNCMYNFLRNLNRSHLSNSNKYYNLWSHYKKCSLDLIYYMVSKYNWLYYLNKIQDHKNHNYTQTHIESS